ncbi:MAG: NADPH:quinone reductase [Planctomycetes bacterium]|nr:NADPH:quinone reductase [Planctomycetota bacterium]
MKAAYIERTGPPDVIRYGDLPKPTPKEGEILVRVAAVSLNPVDTYIRSGAVGMALPKPFIVGCDLAGTVEAVGPGTRRFQAGDRVWGSNQGPLGLGHMVVQMAKAAGARVVTTAGSEEKAEACRMLGADLVINYKTQDVEAGVRGFTGAAGLNVWYETLREPNFARTIELLGKRGRMILMAGRDARPTFPVGPFYTKDLALYGMAMFNASAAEQRGCAEDINRWLAAGKLRPLIGRTFPLAQAAAAHQLQEENTIGKAGTLMGKIVLVP